MLLICTQQANPTSTSPTNASLCASFHVFHPLKDIKATLSFRRRTKGAVSAGAHGWEKRRDLMEARLRLLTGWSPDLGLLWDVRLMQIKIKAGERVLTHTPALPLQVKKNKQKNGQTCSWMECMNSQSHVERQRPFLWRQGHQTSARSRGFSLQKYLL